jgi:4-alpha-glucanotransferase
MPSETFEQLLERAASACGVGSGFWDIWGRHHVTTVEAKQAILRAQGLEAGSAEELERSLAERTLREWRRLTPPVVLADESDRIEFPIQIPADMLGETAHVTVRREDGVVSEHEIPLTGLLQTASIEMEGQTRVRVSASLPVSLPLGYHEIEIRLGGQNATTRYIVTPDRAYAHPYLGRGGRLAGVAISLYGVRSARNWGCGDFTDLHAAVDWAIDDLGAAFVALNPLHAIHNRRPFNTSPYLPNCIFYQNFLYIDVEAVEGYAGNRRVRQLRESPAVQKEIAELRASPLVEYERVSALKLRFLKLIFAGLLRQWRKNTPGQQTDLALSPEFRAFCDREGDLLEKYATHCALDEHLHCREPELWNWPQWPREYQDPDSLETHAFRRKHWRSVMFYQFLQWQIDIQLSGAQQHALNRRLAIGLYHDLALATDSFGSDLWAHRPFFVKGCRVGSPPDDFSPNGQDWGFPPPNTERHREDGYRLFAESIRKNCRHGGALRIDHVMRLFRLYWIPDDCDATRGAYVKERSNDFVRILALESVRNRVVVVGEDLGTVEPEVREELARFGMLSYRLFYFEKNAQSEFRPHGEYVRQALVASTTHDLPTLAGFWIGADIQSRREAGVLDDTAWRAQLEARAIEKQKMLDVLFREGLMRADLPRSAAEYPELTGELHHAVAGFLALTPSQLLVINQEDITKETAQQNLPGTTWQYPNWARKMRFTVEQLRQNPEARNYTAMLRDWVTKSGRTNHPEG